MSTPISNLPLLVLTGPTASGKTALSMHLARALDAEIISCDSVCVYRDMEIGTAKPSREERAEIPHHCLDLYAPDERCTAGDWARHARAALDDTRRRGKLPIIAGGTGLYLRALLEGLAPAPPRDEALRERLRGRRPGSLHRILRRLDPRAAAAIHPNDTPKLIRSLEVTLLARTPQTKQWQQGGRDGLTGYRVLHLGLQPERAELYARINERAAGMFARGLVAETAALQARYGEDCHAFASLGYAQAASLLRGEKTEAETIAAAQQGHRNYAKRQLTWFRRDTTIQWLGAVGDALAAKAMALQVAREHVDAV